MKAQNYVLLGSLLLLGPPAGVAPEAEAAAAVVEDPDAGQQVPATSAPERSGKRRKTLESFSPTEQVPAGSAISFPVDI
jgi:hypothetical protein